MTTYYMQELFLLECFPNTLKQCIYVLLVWDIILLLDRLIKGNSSPPKYTDTHTQTHILTKTFTHTHTHTHTHTVSQLETFKTWIVVVEMISLSQVFKRGCMDTYLSYFLSLQA